MKASSLLIFGGLIAFVGSVFAKKKVAAESLQYRVAGLKLQEKVGFLQYRFLLEIGATNSTKTNLRIDRIEANFFITSIKVATVTATDQQVVSADSETILKLPVLVTGVNAVSALLAAIKTKEKTAVNYEAKIWAEGLPAYKMTGSKLVKEFFQKAQ